MLNKKTGLFFGSDTGNTETIAEKIIERGKEADIFIYRHKLLARALYFTSELGQEISDKLYTAVAIALAYIYKVNKHNSSI